MLNLSAAVQWNSTTGYKLSNLTIQESTSSKVVGHFQVNHPLTTFTMKLHHTTLLVSFHLSKLSFWLISTQRRPSILLTVLMPSRSGKSGCMMKHTLCQLPTNTQSLLLTRRSLAGHLSLVPTLGSLQVS